MGNQGIQAGSLKNTKSIKNTETQISSKLKCFYTNIDGILYGDKIDHLNDYLYIHDPHVIFITETKLGSFQSIPILGNNYRIFRKDRSMGGGGVALLIKKDFYCEITHSELCRDTESLVCNIKMKNNIITAAVIYRPPNSDAASSDRINEIIKNLSDLGHGIIICGDFNYGAIDWNNLNLSQTSYSNFKFIDCLNDSFLCQNVAEFTRFRGSDRPSLLDLVITKSEIEIQNMQYLSPVGNSDHVVLLFDYILSNLTEADRTESYVLNYFKTDFEAMHSFFIDIDWESMFRGLDVEDMWSVFRVKIAEAVDKFVPLKKKNEGGLPQPKWMTKKAREAISRKEASWEKYRKKRNQHNLDNYRYHRNLSTTAVRTARLNYEKKLGSEVKTNPKAFYAYVRSNTKVKEGIAPLKDSNGNLLYDSKSKAKLLNDEFSGIFTIEPDGEVIDLPPFVGTPLESVNFTQDDISKILSGLKGSSCGPDDIHPVILKHFHSTLSYPLYKLFMKSLNESKLPLDWKTSNVIPIYKKGQRSEPLNYRPISLTSVIIRVLERLIKPKLIEHLDNYNIISPHQHGFRKNRSCLTQLLEYFEDITGWLDEEEPVDSIYLDCRKAFDTVPHNRLIEKLKSVGIGGPLLDWIRDYLLGRRQRVTLDKTCSPWTQVLSGVPQGSVLGPVFFLIFINDLLDGLNCTGKLFADDAKIYSKVSKQEDAHGLQLDLDRLVNWSNTWLLDFNQNKCKVLHFGNKNQKNQYRINDTFLEESICERDLGVFVSNKMKPEQHINHVISKANSMLGMIKNTFKNMDEDIFLALYKALVRPLLDYCAQVWSPYFLKDIEAIEKVQRRATKLVPGLVDLTYLDRLEKLKLTNLHERRIRGDMIEVFKILNGFENINKDKFFQPLPYDHLHTRGHAFKLFKPQVKYDLRKYFFSVRIVHNWNSLPDYVVNSNSVNNFKNNYDRYLNRRVDI